MTCVLQQLVLHVLRWFWFVGSWYVSTRNMRCGNTLVILINALLLQKVLLRLFCYFLFLGYKFFHLVSLPTDCPPLWFIFSCGLSLFIVRHLLKGLISVPCCGASLQRGFPSAPNGSLMFYLFRTTSFYIFWLGDGVWILNQEGSVNLGSHSVAQYMPERVLILLWWLSPIAYVDVMSLWASWLVSRFHMSGFMDKVIFPELWLFEVTSNCDLWLEVTLLHGCQKFYH